MIGVTEDVSRLVRTGPLFRQRADLYTDEELSVPGGERDPIQGATAISE